jgi:hypothetical protein
MDGLIVLLALQTVIAGFCWLFLVPLSRRGIMPSNEDFARWLGATVMAGIIAFPLLVLCARAARSVRPWLLLLGAVLFSSVLIFHLDQEVGRFRLIFANQGTVPLRIGFLLLTSLVTLCLFLLLFGITRSLWVTWRASKDPFCANVLMSITALGILPRQLRHAVARAKATAYFLSSMLLYGLGFLVFLYLVPLTGTLCTAVLQGTSTSFADGANPNPDDYQKVFTGVSVIFGVAWLLLLTACRVSTWLEKIGRQSVRATMRDTLASDHRAPILFLRAFGDDQVRLPPSRKPWLAHLIQFGWARPLLDHTVLEEGFPYGPVVALGRPGDAFPPYGAARGYFDDKSWHDAVYGLCRDASAIVFCLDEGDGVWWELEQIMASDARKRTLFLIHPKYRAPEANRAFLDVLSVRAPELLPQPSGSNGVDATGRRELRAAPVIGVYFDKEGMRVLATSSSFGHLAYWLTLRAFLRNQLGNGGIPIDGTAPAKSHTPCSDPAQVPSRNEMMGHRCGCPPRPNLGVQKST